MSEDWQPVPIEEYRSIYSISRQGAVRRDAPTFRDARRSGYLLRHGIRMGYPYVVLCASGGRRLFAVHRLVALAFLPPPKPEQVCVCHKDDDKRNCCAENLFWGTRADNSADMTAKGRGRHGARNGRAVVSAEDVDQMRHLYGKGGFISQQALGEMFGIDQTQVSRIIRRAAWSRY
jgi:hypothetical protein